MEIRKKQFIITKSFDESRIRKGNAYKVYFKNHPKAREMGDNGDGVICLCAAVAGGEVSFVNVSHSFLGGKITLNRCDLKCFEVDKYDIDIVLTWDEEAIFEYVDGLKSGKYKFPESNDDTKNNKIIFTNPIIINNPPTNKSYFPANGVVPLRRKVDDIRAVEKIGMYKIQVAGWDTAFFTDLEYNNSIKRCILFKSGCHNQGVCVEVEYLNYASSPRDEFVYIDATTSNILNICENDEIEIVFSNSLNKKVNPDESETLSDDLHIESEICDGKFTSFSICKDQTNSSKEETNNEKD